MLRYVNVICIVPHWKQLNRKCIYRQHTTARTKSHVRSGLFPYRKVEYLTQSDELFQGKQVLSNREINIGETSHLALFELQLMWERWTGMWWWKGCPTSMYEVTVGSTTEWSGNRNTCTPGRVRITRQAKCSENFSWKLYGSLLVFCVL